MITEVSLRNVRLFADDLRTFRLAPLTVFCGSNSSGKSTILKIFPLLRQSQGIRESGEEESGKLRFKGSQVDLGNYRSLVSNNEVTRKMQFGLRVSNKTYPSFIQFLQFVKKNEPGEFKTNNASEEPIADYELECSFEFIAETPDQSVAPPNADKLASGGLLSAHFCIIYNGEALLSWSLEKLESAKTSQDSSSIETSQRLYKLALPTCYFEKTGLAERILPQKSKVPEITTLIALVRGILPTTMIADPKPEPSAPGAEGEHNWQRWPMPTIIEWQLDLFRGALLDTHYVAPLRTPGKRYYVADLDVVPGMDPTGEFLPYILRDKGSSKIINALPDKPGAPIEQKLEDALSSWLRYLRTGSFIGSEVKQAEFELSTAEILVELKLKSLHEIHKHSLADSGFGYSQIVPVLVRGLLTPPEGTLVVEQPELHLHPALQVRVADFFIAMASIGKQVILESHSEHLVNALRVRAAEDTTNKISQLCKIYFLSTESEKPQVYDLSVQPDGTLNEWPESFFGEALSLSGRLLRAQRNAVKKEN